ncbi:ankyrin repeat-containing protein NPR4 isoform X2 [Lactuca sativa]|uniref:ankyrin repeat-containing protein NPR4 isoform X2 n=1 Tax=Lactuca sativa TaxID=4236 RepID=UPI001C690B44|nr:ankyrin repeat-containing protein NPR4 isoform X2 [Lactuca sativa]
MASSSSNPHVTLEVKEEYPYPSHVYTPSFVSLKLNGRDEYRIWKTQMICLLESHVMLGFIDGRFVRPDEASSSSNVSGKEKVGDHQTHHGLWRKSDALVKGWILGSLSKETLGYVVNRLTGISHHDDFSAKDVWDELQTMYGPPVFPQLPHVVTDKLQDQDIAGALQNLYHSTRKGDWDRVERILREGRVTVIDKITNNGNTALHVAVGTSKKREFLEKLLEMIPENTQLLDVRNSDGSTPLHVAAIIGNTEAADILVARNHESLFAKDNKGQTPLALALSNMHTETARHLLQHIDTVTDDIQKDALFSGTTGDDLLVTAISSKDFRFARKLLEHYKTLHSDAVLTAIAQNFPREACSFGRYAVADFILILFLLIALLLVSPFRKERYEIHLHAMYMLGEVCHLIQRTNHSSSYHHYYTNPILEATRQNANEVVEEIVNWFPNAIWSANEDGHNFILYAAINRSEKVYNLLYHMSEHKNIYRTLEDSSRNNLLHLAARLAPSNKLNLISGAALQIQRELQWFKEMEKFICPLSIIKKNSLNETPQMVFTREHKELVIEGEKWMKSTAESYTITAALIITIVFAAAITVPGGSDQNKGIPIFTSNAAFTVFAISDAISLFAAVTSLLMFLSILTARFAEQDFLFKLPTKLIIGLSTLFISTTAMIAAFAATLYLVFGQSNSRILIPIAVLTCLPITSFVTLQFPLVLDLMSATYGRSIFGRNKSYYGLFGGILI